MSADDDVPWWEKAARAFERPADGKLGLAELAKRIQPNTVQTPALDLVDAELERLLDTPDGRLIISIGPQEGKSSRCAMILPVAILRARPDTRVVLASYALRLARRNSRKVRDAITAHPEFGYKVRRDVAAQDEWQLEGHEGGVVAAGIATGLTGKPADFLVIDDPHEDQKDADSPTMRDNVWDWWETVGSTRLAPGAQVLLIQTRWHHEDLAGKLLAAPDGHRWRVLNIPAIADHDPNKDETDPLGREPGEWLESARGRTVEQWEDIRRSKGARAFNSLYQGRPSPAEGGMFKRHWWGRFDAEFWFTYDTGTRWIPGDVEVCQSWDLTFKDVDTADYVVGQVWARRGADVFLVDQVRERMNFPDTCAAVRKMSARWPQATAKYIEDKANGPAVIAALRKTVPGLIPIEPEGSKAARAAAISPYVEAGNVWLPAAELAAWADELIDEAAAFPQSAHDDQVDAMSQAINRMLLSPWLDLGVIEPDEFDDDRVEISLY